MLHKKMLALVRKATLVSWGKSPNLQGRKANHAATEMAKPIIPQPAPKKCVTTTQLFPRIRKTANPNHPRRIVAVVRLPNAIITVKGMIIFVQFVLTNM